MSLRLKLPLHGRSHRHAGSDPIGTFIEYDVLNVGDWLSVEVTGGGGVLGRGFSWYAGPDSYHDMEWKCFDGSLTGDMLLSPYNFDVQAQQMNFSTLDSDVGGGGGSLALNAQTDLTMVALDDVTLTAGGQMDLRIGAAQTYTIKDSTGSPKIQWTEGTNDLHIPTGGTIVADL